MTPAEETWICRLVVRRADDSIEIREALASTLLEVYPGSACVLVWAAVLLRLDSPEIRHSIAALAGEDTAAEVSALIAQIERRPDSLPDAGGALSK